MTITNPESGTTVHEIAPDIFRISTPVPRCIAHLDDRARQVLLLTFHDDRSADEIAAVLAISAGNVRVVRHRALASLRHCLDGGAS